MGRPFPLGQHGRREVLLDKGAQLPPDLGDRGLHQVLLHIGEGPEMGVVGNQYRLPDRLPDFGKTLDRAGDQVDGEEAEQSQKPPGVVHVEKAKSLEETVGGLAVSLEIFLGGAPLLDDGADDRGGGQQNENDDGQLEGAEKVPKGGGGVTILGAQDYFSWSGVPSSIAAKTGFGRSRQ